MKKATLIIAALLLAFTLVGQSQKQDSLVASITMDTTTFKSMVQLIKENIPSTTKTGQLILQNVLQPLYMNLRLVKRETSPAIKPKKQ